jgi:hypothetical protein
VPRPSGDTAGAAVGAVLVIVRPPGRVGVTAGIERRRVSRRSPR